MSLAQLSQLLPLPQEELRQVVDYATTLSKPEAASHFSNLLGDSPLAVDFIASFNAQRSEPATTGSSGRDEPPAAVPKGKRAPKKKKPAIHTPEARKVGEYAGPAAGTAYSKADRDLEYIATRASAPSSSHGSRAATPPVQQQGPQPKQQPKQPKQHASAGFFISDVASKAKGKSSSSCRSSTPKPSGAKTAATKVSIAGGTPMAGQSTALADLDAAIRALEITTNPSLESGTRPRCNCVATRHPLQSAAPNCLSCGKVVCVKEGLGPCSFCDAPLVSPGEVQAMIRELKDERGRERMAAQAAANRRADVSKKPAPFAGRGVGNADQGAALAEAAAKAREHRDKLLDFQAQNARRTTVRDEAADFDVGEAMSGTGSLWTGPEERAKELKRQQKLMREMEWNAKPDYEKRRQVLSIDLVGGKAVRKMAAVERPATPEPEGEEEAGARGEAPGNAGGRRRTGGEGGAFSGNPLLGALLRPVYEPRGGEAGEGGGADGEAERPRGPRKGWRRVQDDLDDNENVILDGGVHGHGDGAGAEPGSPAVAA